MRTPHLLLMVVAVATGWWVAGATGAAAAPPVAQVVANAEQYFPDGTGSRWQYRGQVVEGPMQTIATKGFVNVSTVKGTEIVRGVSVKVFHDTNPGNHGPQNSYYRRDAAGIVYYGSDPGTPLEKQLVPYQIVRFPLMVPSSFQQFDRKGLDFGNDLDGDGTNEKVDVEATVSVVGREPVTVPAGAYPDAVRIEARMTLRIHLSSETKRSAVGTDTMVAWFAKGVGLVKYVERQELPPFRTDRGFVSEITEELEEATIQLEPAASLGRSEAPPDGVFRHDPRDQKLAEIVLAASLRSHTR
ncbi:hypothetical protein [Nitrospira sp. Kam-Ns4a]